MTSVPPLAEPLLQTMRDLLAEYLRCVACAEDLIAGLVSGNPSAVMTAVAAQSMACGEMEAVERQRRQAELALARSLTGWDRAGSPQGKLTITALLTLLPEEQASELSRLRTELLRALVRLQALQNHGGVLARSALAALRRSGAAAGGTSTYGPHGEQRAPCGQPRRQVWRSA